MTLFLVEIVWTTTAYQWRESHGKNNGVLIESDRLTKVPGVGRDFEHRKRGLLEGVDADRLDRF